MSTLNIKERVIQEVQVGIRMTKESKEHLDHLVKKYNTSQAVVIMEALRAVE